MHAVSFVANLENAFAESGLLRQLFEVLGVGVVVQGEVGLQHAQLVVLERRSKSLLPRRRRQRRHCSRRTVLAAGELFTNRRQPRRRLRRTAIHNCSHNVFLVSLHASSVQERGTSGKTTPPNLFREGTNSSPTISPYSVMIYTFDVMTLCIVKIHACIHTYIFAYLKKIVSRNLKHVKQSQ